MPVLLTTPVVTVGDLIENTRFHLLGSHRIELNVLSASIDDDERTMAFTYPLAGLVPNTYLGIEDEILFVWSTAASSAVVQRGMLGTSAATHDAGALVEINPRFPKFQVRYALREEIRSWGPQVYQVKSTTLTTINNVAGYDLGELGRFYNILEVHRESSVGVGRVNPQTEPRVRWRLVRNAPPADFPSGLALILGEEFFTPPFPTVTVTYAAPFDLDTFFDTTDVIRTIGLDENWLDIPPLGAAWRLEVTREIARLSPESQGLPADLALVPAGATQRAGIGYKALRDARINDAVWQLRTQHPWIRS